MSKRRILITGASGLLGINLALELSKGYTVFGQVNNNIPNTDAFNVIQTNLLSPQAAERIVDETQPDWVIHCAALANLDACEAQPKQAQQLNTEIPRILAGYVARGGARLLHVSTDAVFDGHKGNYSEEDLPNPLSTYASTKFEAETAVAEANPEAIIARVNLFGWSLSTTRSLAEFFFYNLAEGRQVMGFTDVFFCPLLANDLARIFIKMLEAKLTGLYHAVSSECCSKYAFGVAIARIFGLDESLISAASVYESGLKAARSPNLSMDTGKLSSALGETLPTISTGLESFYTLYQQGYPQKLRELSTARPKRR